ncbi:MAG TPA: pyruvate kinase [Bacillota bacterium]|nr:pyruvate kinase [Bacillota bacterium]HPJ23871.1 pyruvate kinase [Bacillota bacterium]
MKRKTKIVCTIGPATDSPEMIGKLIDAGMNVSRLNFSHGTREEHERRINMIREVAQERNRYIGIMADTKGPEIRTGMFENNKATFKKGDIVEVVKEEVLGNNERFHISAPELFDDIEVGDYLLIDDGKIRLDVIAKKPESFTCKVFNPGDIKSKKGVNVPNVKLSMPFISAKDDEDIRFAARMRVDMIAMSFVRRKDDVLAIREILKQENNPTIELIAKIENQEGVDNLDEILKVVDGIMVARGDLGVEVSTQLVPIYQKKIISRSNEVGKPVITATHMLESMILSPRPTRAEASDVANAILDGSDAIMLSGETAAGNYPIEAVLTMDTIAKAIEDTINYDDRLEKAIKSSHHTVNDAIGIAVSQTVMTLPKAEVIIAFTETGGTAKRMCKFRPSKPIIAITDNIETCQKLSYYCGVFAALVDDVNDFPSHDSVASRVAKDFGFKKGQTMVLTSGWGQKHGKTNTLRIVDIE